MKSEMLKLKENLGILLWQVVWAALKIYPAADAMKIYCRKEGNELEKLAFKKEPEVFKITFPKK